MLAAVYGLLLSRRQARATFEHQFVARYWELDDDRRHEPDDQSRFWQRYLRLCEDEYEAMRLGQISWRTWEVWHDAIRDATVTQGEVVTPAHEWLSTCVRLADHPGSNCDGIFDATANEHSKHSGHLSSRWRISPTRLAFRLTNAMQRQLHAMR